MKFEALYLALTALHESSFMKNNQGKKRDVGFAKITGLIVFLVFTFSAAIQAQELKFNRIAMTSDLVVYSVIQDEAGFIWLGTEQGLQKYDGYTLQAFQHDPFRNSISHNDVGCLWYDKEGYIWAATWGGGINKFDPRTEKFTYYRNIPEQPRSLSDNRVQSIYQDRSGTLWFGTYTGGLNRFNPLTEEFHRYIHDPNDPASISNNRIWSIQEDQEGNLWVATDDGLNRLDAERKRFTRFYHDPRNPNSLSDNRIQWLYFDRKGDLWISTKNGLNRLTIRTQSFTRFYHVKGRSTSLSHNVAYTVYEDHNGVLWIGTIGGGLNQYYPEENKFVSYHYMPDNTLSLSNNDIRAIYEDRSGVLWIGTRGGGVNTLDLKPKKFQLVTYRPGATQGLSYNRVSAFTESSDHIIWIGTDGGGLNRFDPKAGIFLPVNQGLFPRGRFSFSRIRTLHQSASGALWVGSYGDGLLKIDPLSKHIEHFTRRLNDSLSLPDDKVNVILEDKEGDFWIGTDEGLSRYDPEKGIFKNYKQSAYGLSHNSILCLFEDRTGILWIGTWGGGLNRMDKKTEQFTTYQHDSLRTKSLSNNEVHVIYEDRVGNLWIGTQGGLNRLDRTSGEFTCYTKEHGLGINEIRGILEDNNGNLWISTTNGLSKFHPTSETFRNYDIEDGLQGRQFLHGAYFKDSRGRFYFGGINGFNLFYPDSIHDNIMIPPVVITAFRVFDKKIFYQTTPSLTDRIEIRYTDNFFSFEFAALDYSQPNKNQYTYKLEGFDQRWIYSGTRRYASYTNLDPGEYIFRVKGSNNDEIWNEEGTALRVYIRPPFWKTLWFQVFSLLSAALLIWALYRLRIRTIQRQKKTLEQQVAERTSELQKSRDYIESKNKELEKINIIVQSINSGIGLKQFLDSILIKTQLFRNLQRAVALVYNPRINRFETLSGYYPYVRQESEPDFSLQEIEEQYLAGTQEIYPDIFAVYRTRHIGGEEAAIDTAHRLVLRIEAQGAVEGFLIFESNPSDQGLDLTEVKFLNTIKEHIISGFVKARLLKEVQDTNEELKRLNDKKNEFLGFAAHDLRSPLSAILGHIDLLLQDIREGAIDTASAIKDLETVYHSAKQMVQLITDLLDISAIESGKINLDMRPNNLITILDECERIHHKAAQQKNINLNILKDPLPEISFDKERIFEVVDNLLSNAIKYSYPGGQVTVYCELKDSALITHIKDSGQGLSEEDQREIFTSFKRLSSKPTAGESSTRLGLAIVKKIVELHGGKVWLVSQKGAGSTFSFSLPIIKIP